jgi:serine/threonine-protein kinase
LATRFGPYEILYELKAGGMGAVLLGRRRGPGAFEQLVAIKTIRPEYAGTPSVRGMFLDEAAILARINHPGIATVHDFGEEGGTLYMVMEYVAGLAFREVQELRPAPAVVARAIAEACRSLHAAHEIRDLSGTGLGLVHRDVSPDNLMLGYDGHVKVIDFGIALIKNRQAPVTEFGTVKGKPPYMSPEQVKNEAIDRRSDVFSLGVVLWELLTNQSLFDGDSIYAIARAVEHQEILPPSQVLGMPLPAGLDAVVMGALERDRERRWPSAAAFAEQLEQVITAAGDVTLEAWSERELHDSREAHRQWLVRVTGGHATTPRPLGRATGAVTQLAVMDTNPAGVAPSPPVTPPSRDDILPGQSTHIPAPVDDSSLDRLPRRSLVWPVLVALLVMLGVGGAIYMTRDRASVPPPRDAPTRDAFVVIRPTQLDAAIDAPADAAIDAPVDAAIDAPIDAGHRMVNPPRDTHPHDPPHDAAPPPADAPDAPTGTGLLVVIHKSTTWLQILVDGQPFGPTPMLKGKTIPAGRHTIVLVHPTTGEIELTRTVTVHAGETITID